MVAPTYARRGGYETFLTGISIARSIDTPDPGTLRRHIQNDETE
jgi:hypothetical protein